MSRTLLLLWTIVNEDFLKEKRRRKGAASQRRNERVTLFRNCDRQPRPSAMHPSKRPLASCQGVCRAKLLQKEDPGARQIQSLPASVCRAEPGPHPPATQCRYYTRLLRPP